MINKQYIFQNLTKSPDNKSLLCSVNKIISQLHFYSSHLFISKLAIYCCYTLKLYFYKIQPRLSTTPLVYTVENGADCRFIATAISSVVPKSQI